MNKIKSMLRYLASDIDNLALLPIGVATIYFISVAPIYVWIGWLLALLHQFRYTFSERYNKKLLMYTEYLKIVYKTTKDSYNIKEFKDFTISDLKELKAKLEAEINKSKEPLIVTKRYKRKSDEEIEAEAEHRLVNNSNIVDIAIKQTHRHKMEYLSWANSYPEAAQVWEGCALDEQSIIEYLRLK